MTAPSGVKRILSVTQTVPDLEAAARFYAEALAFEREAGERRLSPAECGLLGITEGSVASLALRLGRQRLTLLRFDPAGAPYPADSTSSDLWFQHCAIVVGDMRRAYDRVTEAGASAITEGGPQHLPQNTGGVTAFKLRNPYGHPLELLGFPGGVGDPCWHEGDAEFRGIDHTAIAVSDHDRSVAFYGDVLGLTPSSRSHNRGDGQSRLDAIPADDVRVVALEPGVAPPHLELLAYRTGRRRRLASVHPGDAAVSRTIAAADVEAIAERLGRGGHGFTAGRWDDRPAVAFEDPDGHAWICRAD